MATEMGRMPFFYNQEGRLVQVDYALQDIKGVVHVVVDVGRRPGVAGRMTHHASAIAATIARIASVRALGNRRTPGIGAAVRPMNAGYSGIDKNAMPSDTARTGSSRRSGTRSRRAATWS